MESNPAQNSQQNQPTSSATEKAKRVRKPKQPKTSTESASVAVAAPAEKKIEKKPKMTPDQRRESRKKAAYDRKYLGIGKPLKERQQRQATEAELARQKGFGQNTARIAEKYKQIKADPAQFAKLQEEAWRQTQEKYKSWPYSVSTFKPVNTWTAFTNIEKATLKAH